MLDIREDAYYRYLGFPILPLNIDRAMCRKLDTDVNRDSSPCPPIFVPVAPKCSPRVNHLSTWDMKRIERVGCAGLAALFGVAGVPLPLG